MSIVFPTIEELKKNYDELCGMVYSIKNVSDLRNVMRKCEIGINELNAIETFNSTDAELSEEMKNFNCFVVDCYKALDGIILDNNGVQFGFSYSDDACFFPIASWGEFDKSFFDDSDNYIELINEKTGCEFPLPSEIKKDYYELLSIAPSINSLGDLAKFDNAKYELEINGCPVKKMDNNLLSKELQYFEWFRIESFGCLTYIYFCENGEIRFDITGDDTIVDGQPINFFDNPDNYIKAINDFIESERI